MSKICDLPELGDFGELLYFVNVYEENGKLKIELDPEGNIKTNMHRLTNRIIDFTKKGKVLKLDHDLYFRLNNGINILTGEIKESIRSIVENLFYNKKIV